jgi:hypothetical protein
MANAGAAAVKGKGLPQARLYVKGVVTSFRR